MVLYEMCVFLILLYLSTAFCGLEIERSNNICKNDVHKLISQIMNEEEATTYLTTLVILHNNDSDLIPVIKTNALIVISDNQIYQYKKFKYSIIIYFIDSIKHAVNIIRTLNYHVNSTKWDPNNKILIFISEVITQERALEIEHGLNYFFAISWNYQYLNIVVIYCSSIKNQLKVFTYNPFLRIVEDKSNYLKYRNIFNNKLTNLHGYPLRVVQVPYVPRAFNVVNNGTRNLAGVDKKIISILIHHLNATGKIDSHNSISLYSLQNIILGLSNNVSDIFFNLVTLIPRLGRNLYPFARDDVCVLVPNAEEIPVYLKMFFPFSILCWAIIFFSIICVEVLWYFLKKNNSSIFKHNPKQYCLVLHFCKLVLPLLNFSPGYSFQYSSNKEKLLLITWMIYCFHVCTSYQSVLFSFLTVPRYSEELNSIEEIERSGIKVMAAASDIDFLQHFEAIDQSFVVRLNSYPYFQGKFENRSIGFLLRTQMGNFYINQQDKLGDSIRYRFAKDCILPSVAVYYVNYQSAFINRFNNLIARIIQSGITSKLANDAQHEFLMTTNVKQSHDECEDDKTQELSDLYFVFYLLFVGYAISSIAFIIEILINHLQNYRKMNNAT